MSRSVTVVWWQVLLLVGFAGGASTIATVKIVKPTLDRVIETNESQAFSASVFTSAIDSFSTRLVRVEQVVRLRPDPTPTLGEILHAVELLPRDLPECPPPVEPQDYTQDLASIASRLDELPRFRATISSLRETLVALPDSHTIELGIRREGERRFRLYVIEGEDVHWEKR